MWRADFFFGTKDKKDKLRVNNINLNIKPEKGAWKFQSEPQPARRQGCGVGGLVKKVKLSKL